MEQPQEQMQVSAMQASRPGTSRGLNGCSVVWIGERAFKASAQVKEQIEGLGFLLKIYRSYDRCTRALDKKGSLSAATVFLVSQADAAQLLEYLQVRQPQGLRILVDADGSSPSEAWELSCSLPQMEDCDLRVCCNWDEVVHILCECSSEALFMGGLVAVSAINDGTDVDPNSQPLAMVREKGSSSEGNNGVADNPWTLVWISDQAFKPTAVSMKATLESLGCQVKGYKTNKNAARALDKKRALVRTVVLVSGGEAAPFLAYLTSRPELANTPVVVEASSRAVPIREGPTVQVAESFEASCALVFKIANEPGFA